MRKIDRFIEYMKIKGLNDNKVTLECGLSQGLLGQARTGKSDLGAKTIDKILNKYQDLNQVWLLTGEGEMLKSSVSIENGDGSTQIIGDGNHVGAHSTIDIALQEITAQRKLVEKAHELIQEQVRINKEQTDKFLAIIDKLTEK